MKVHELFESEERSILSVMGEQPDNVTGSFSCSLKDLTSLKGCPSYVSGDFFCSHNRLKNLEGCPTYVGAMFVCDSNQIESLHNIHRHIKYIGNEIDLSRNPLKSHVLGLLLIKGLKMVFLDTAKGKLEDILNKHLQGDRDVFACQEELIEAGFEDYAQL